MRCLRRASAPRLLLRLRGAAAATLALAVAGAAPAQGLALDPVPPAPALADQGATIALVATLTDEIRSLESRMPEEIQANARLRATILARVQLRRLALDLLARGAEPGGVRDALAMYGFRLADVRRRTDLLLGSFADDSLRVGTPPAPLGVRLRDLAERRLRRFVEVSPKAFAASTLADRDQVDATVAAATRDLGDALAILEGMWTGEDLGSGWPTSDEIVAVRSTGGRPVSAPDAEPRPDGDDLRSADPCDPTTRETLLPATAAAVGRRCAAGDVDVPELRIAVALALAAASAEWLTANERDLLDRRAAALVDGSGERDLLSAQAEMLTTERRLAAALASARQARELDRDTVTGTVRLALFGGAADGNVLADDPPRLARAIRRLSDALELSALARSRKPDDSLPRDMRQLARDFERAYGRCESSTYERLPALLTRDDALSDPELVSLIPTQRDALADLDRIASAQRLVDAIAGVRPSAARKVAQHVRTMLRWMLDPSRRAAALTAFEALERQVALFSPLPFESELRQESAEAISLTAGQPRALANAIDSARAAWADGWASGEGGGAAAKRMLLLYRLLRLMDAFAAGVATPDERNDIALLTRWGAFHATRASMSPAMVDLTASLKLAANAATSGNDEVLATELGRLDRHTPMVQVVGRLLDELRPWLDSRPGSAAGVLAAIREPPQRDAWGFAARDRVASLARFARELDHVRRGGERDAEGPLLSYLADLSRSILETLGQERSPVPPLPPLAEPTLPPGRRDRG